MLRLSYVVRSLFLPALSAAVLVPAACHRPAPQGVVSGESGQTAAGDDLGEEVLPADKAPDEAPLRPAKGIPIYKLTDPRIGNLGPGPSPQLTVHYERVSGEEFGTGPTLVVRTPDGRERTAALGGFGPLQGQKKADDLVVDLGFQGGPGGRPPKSVEVYFVQNDRRWENEGFRPKFKVSNSVVLGDMGQPLQFARDWMPDEEAKIINPPAANANGNVGEDTAFVGHTMGLLPDRRYADPSKRPVVGVLYSVGEGEPDKGQKVKCLVHLTPAYDARQPRSSQQALFARPGYAVGALNVKTKKIVTAVQVVFMKPKPDGTLDPTDSYTSPWLGYPEEADAEGKVSGEGRKVIGLHLKHFGVVYAVALVVE
jgi:hypothetical protein